jgi:hypothetical protein
LCSTVVESAAGRSTAVVGMPSFVAGQGERIHPVHCTLASCSLQGYQPPEPTAAVDYCRCRGSPAVARGSGEDVVGGGEQRHVAAVEERGGVEP